MNVLIPLKEYVDLHEDEFFKRFMYTYSLFESLCKYSDLDKILETHGAYDGQLDIVLLFSKYIVGMVMKEKLSSNHTVTFTKKMIEDLFKKEKNIDIKNVFFEKIIITVSDNQSSYNSKENLNKDALLESVEINLDDKEDLSNAGNVITIFYHELLHAYDNWKRLLNKSKSLNVKVQELNYNELTDKSSLNMNDMDGLVHGVIKELLYISNKIEKNAFTTELHSVVASWKLSNIYPSYAAAIKKFKETDHWKSLEGLQSIIDYDDQEIKDMLVKWYNEESNQKLPKGKALSKIKFLLRKCKEKYEDLAPKVYFDYIESNNKELRKLTENREYSLRYIPCLATYNNLNKERK